MHFAPLIDKCKAKVEGWILKKLSMAGRAELIKTVIHNTLSFWAMTFKLLVSIVKEIKRLSANFLWNDKLHAWKWEDICKTKEGGLGIRRISDISEAAGIRLFWRLSTTVSLWAKWMFNKYLGN